MVRIFIIFLCFINFSLSVFSQEEKFSRSFSYGLRQAKAELLYEDDHYYFVMGYSEDSIGPELGLHVAIHNKTNGDVIHNAYFELDSTWMFIGNSIRVHEVKDTLYFCATARGRVHLMAYAKANRSLFIKRTIVNPFQGGTYTHDMLREDNRFLISFTANGDTFAKPAIWIVNDDGSDEIKIIEGSDRLIVSGKLIHINNGNYLLTSTWTPPTEYRYTVNICELDSNFNLQWIWSTPEWEKAFLNSELLSINDEEILVLYRAEVQDEILKRRAWPHHIMRFNYKTKKVVWKKNIALPATASQSYIGGMVKSQRDQGTVLVVTNVYGSNVNIDSLIQNGRVLKIDYNGKIIWQRDYAIYNQIPLTYNTFHNIIPTSDDNYLIGGNTYDKQIVAWLVKINEDGHIVGDTTSSIQWADTKWHDYITIYPNPVHDVLYINQDDITDVEYILMDMRGKEAGRYDGSGSFRSSVWDISHLPEGSYILTIKNKGKLMGSTKIVKAGR